MMRTLLVSSLLASLLAACGSAPLVEPGTPENRASGKTPTRKPNVVLKRGGGFYKDDGPADDIPDGLDDIPDAVPKWELLHKPAMRPYSVLGKDYTPNTALQPYRARGIASWYGKKFHGQKTSLGEPYDMFAMTAAHTTLAIPSYVRVTHLQSGKSVIVRVTDRGPFHADRIIDLSYTAAYKLGLVNGGSGMVEVESIIPGDAVSTTYAQVAPMRDPIAALGAATATTAAPPTRSSGENTPLGQGVFLQLGAFANADNAEILKNHLLRELDWLTEPMRINTGGGLHRLQLGPYASRTDADLVAEKIRNALGYRPTVVTR